MKLRLLFAALFTVTISVWLAAMTAHALPKLVATDGGRTRMLVAGNRGPVVVLDTFGEMPLDHWGTIQWRCAEFGRVVTYDHRSTGGSDPGPKPRDARQIATELRAALRAAGLEPPYILVGYSFGGPYSRVFADLYPEEVGGMVLIDPSQEEFFDWLKTRRPDLNRISPELEAAQEEMGCTWRSLNQARAAKLPAVPLTLITAMKPFGENDRRLRPQWLACHQRWVSRIPGAQHIVTERSDHGIIWEEPDLVVKTIRDVVERVKLTQ
jgi:pimeloyl-ACP methyl ester carboxylesterase